MFTPLTVSFTVSRALSGSVAASNAGLTLNTKGTTPVSG
jgi:hypothetical protein